MSEAYIPVQEVSDLYVSALCGNAAAALVVYDWLLCLSQEVEFIWNGHSKVTASSLVYAFSRYSIFTQVVLSVATNFPMSNMVLGTIAFSAFSALRAYALSNRNVWSAAIVLGLMLPPTVLELLHCFYQLSVAVGIRGSQLAAELLVVGITWWYTYQSHRIRQGINMGNTVSAFLFYNGSLYFLFLVILYGIDIVLHIIPGAAGFAVDDGLLTTFYDPITSILVCRFMLSLRQFDTTNARVTFSIPRSLVQEVPPMASAVIEFGAQPSRHLPPFIMSFAQPVHLDPALDETEVDVVVRDERESDTEDDEKSAPIRATQCPMASRPTSAALQYSV